MDDIWGKSFKVGSTIRIRYPADYMVSQQPRLMAAIEKINKVGAARSRFSSGDFVMLSDWASSMLAGDLTAAKQIGGALLSHWDVKDGWTDWYQWAEELP